MVERDSAFLWETEALRSQNSRPPVGRGSTHPGAILEASDWLTLREASEATGVPADTIRKWARHENIPSFLEKTDDGHLRLVSLTGIRRWAEEIGRELGTPESSDLPDDTGSGTDIQVDLTPHEGEPPEQLEAPEGSMLVPLDAWNKMLNQLGNLHEAGQQLAEARERAAKAETEARFLKERLADMRAELERTRQATEAAQQARGEIEDDAEPDGDRDSSTPATSTTLPGTAAALARKLYQGWRQKRRS